MNSPVAEWPNKGVTAVWGPTDDAAFVYALTSEWAGIAREALFGGHLAPIMYDVAMYLMSPTEVPFLAPADGIQVRS
eukprot:2308865-Pyramimonas_sp.AAC.1